MRFLSKSTTSFRLKLFCWKWIDWIDHHHLIHPTIDRSHLIIDFQSIITMLRHFHFVLHLVLDPSSLEIEFRPLSNTRSPSSLHLAISLSCWSLRRFVQLFLHFNLRYSLKFLFEKNDFNTFTTMWPTGGPRFIIARICIEKHFLLIFS